VIVVDTNVVSELMRPSPSHGSGTGNVIALGETLIFVCDLVSA
jgi:predicted nucleic acid-binding protein